MIWFRKEGTLFRRGINITRSAYATYIYWAWMRRIWLKPYWRLHSMKTGVVPLVVLRIPQYGHHQESEANRRLRFSRLVR